MFHLTPQQTDDAAAVSALLDRAFGPGRKAKTSYTFRRGLAPVHGLSFVAREHGVVVGTIRYWPVRVAGDGAAVPALLLGPVAVEPVRQGEGMGVELIRHTLRLAAAAGHRVVLLVGDADYYGRFGFEPAAPLGIAMPGQPDRLMVRELVPGALDGLRGTVVHWGCLRRGAAARAA
ncbi:MAG: N-acetyltransferase [Hyphomicrobiales bacterium]|nr:N-acetyltransferase [Hyphomicrobiales bacterium]MCP5374019.1 N-acetyltransferase [Hyphomicrobiales bacterium]